MKGRTKGLMDKASRAIEAAETLLKNGQGEFSAGRAYYAMFYTAEALLNEKDLRYSKHGGVHGAFGEYFIKTGIAEYFADVTGHINKNQFMTGIQQTFLSYQQDA